MDVNFGAYKMLTFLSLIVYGENIQEETLGSHPGNHSHLLPGLMSTPTLENK